MILLYGDQVKVRLHSSEAVVSKYIYMYRKGAHEVEYNGTLYCATDNFYDKSCVRFVGKPCVLLKCEVK